MFLAEFAKKKEKEKRTTLRDRIIGTTNAGKAFRAGVGLSALGLGVYGLKNKQGVKNLVKNPKDFYTRDVRDLPQTVKTTMTHSQVKQPGDEVLLTRNGNKKVVTDPNNVVDRKPGEFLSKTHQQRTKMFDKTVRETYSKDIERGFLGSGRKVKWGNISKTAAIGGGALAVPTTMAYVAGSKKDKEDIEKRIGSGSKRLSKGLESTRRFINTLHRVSR